MTVRSVILGLVGVVVIGMITFFNDRILDQTHLIGNNLPVVVYGMLLVYLLVVATWLGRKALRGPEMAVALAVVLAACCVPGSSLLRTFTSALVQPHHYNRIKPGWRQEQVMQLVPDRMLADVSRDENRVLDGFRQGLRTGPRPISPRAVPWRDWLRTFAFWIPIVVTLWLAVLGLSLVLHRQWSRHEHLPYPIVAFTNSLFPEAGQRLSSVFRGRVFWIGFGLVFLVHMSGYAAEIFPDYVIPVRRQFNLQAFRQLATWLDHWQGRRLLSPILYFTVIGVAFLIPKDVSFSLGIGPYLYATAIGVLMSYGIQVETSAIGAGNYMAPTPKMFLLLGANLGLFAFILYSGRHHYGHVFGSALRGRADPGVRPYEAWGVRLFLAMSAVLVLQLCLAGIAWPFAVLYVAVMMILYVVMARLISEAGLFYMQPFVLPCAAAWGLFGVQVIGLRTLILMQLVSTILLVDPRESLIPFLMNNWKLLELQRVRIGRTAVFCAVALLLCLTVALPVSLYLQYDYGSDAQDGWADAHVPKFALDNATALKQQLKARGELETAMNPAGWSALSRIRIPPACGWALVVGLAGAVLLALARLRLPWWPLHPILLVTCATTPLVRTAPSFLLGWAAKAAVDRYGGPALVKRLRPLVFGLIAGEVFSAIVPSLIGAVYFLFTGETLTAFYVLPA